ncbi:hypothetical protein LTEGF4_26290 (plasmid) [Limnohabitans sp. TEGF004]|nr:hypothetical protein LTEGF4_26290 [Limnohabitans sp. TEGF004]
MFVDLREAGETCGKDRVERLMRSHKIQAVRGYKSPKSVKSRPSILDRILGARQTLSETADAAVAIMEAATKAQAEKAQADKPARGKGGSQANSCCCSKGSLPTIVI